ncbi:NCKAP5 family protein [Megaselia abdita]
MFEMERLGVEVQAKCCCEVPLTSIRHRQKRNYFNQCGVMAFENELKEKIDNMNRSMKSKEKKVIQACRDHNALQIRFTKQEALLINMQNENKQLHQRIRQYEHCLDDVMSKVVNALVAEDSLREEVTMLKTRVRDLEAQNAAFSLCVAPSKGKDEGYCTMSSGQPQPNGSHLEDLPEEPEHWLLPAEPTEMEDWSLSQDELGVITFDDEDANEEDGHWLWNNNDFLKTTTFESQTDGITRLLQDTIIYSDDEELTHKPFSKDFYKLVSGSSKSLQSHQAIDSDDESYNDFISTIERQRRKRECISSPTPSEAGLAQLTTCSSSSDSESRSTIELGTEIEKNDIILKEVKKLKSTRSQIPCSSWRRCNGWRRVPVPRASNGSSLPPIKPMANSCRASTIKSKIPPPVPIRRSYSNK